MMSLRRALIGFVAAGCLFLLVEVLIEHREVVGKEPIAWVPAATLGLVLIVCLAVFAQWQRRWWQAVRVVSALLILVGLAGLYFHNAERLGIKREEEEELEAEEHRAPPFAPLALAGMGVLGLTAMSQKWKEEDSAS